MNDHGDFREIQQICLQKKEKYFSLFGVDYVCKATKEDVILYSQMGYEQIILDFGVVKDEVSHTWHRCNQLFLLGSFSEWQIGEFLNLADKKMLRKQVIFCSVFGSDEWQKGLRSQLKARIRRVPLFLDAFTLEYEVIQFFEQIL